METKHYCGLQYFVTRDFFQQSDILLQLLITLGPVRTLRNMWLIIFPSWYYLSISQCLQRREV